MISIWNQQFLFEKVSVIKEIEMIFIEPNVNNFGRKWTGVVLSVGTRSLFTKI